MSLISWLQSPSAVILEPPKIKSDTVSTVSPSISHEVIGHPRSTLMLEFCLCFFLFACPDQSSFRYGQALFSYALLYCTLQILFFFVFFFYFFYRLRFVETLPWVYQQHFSDSICSLCVSGSHFGYSQNISFFSLLSHLLWWCVISDLWCYCCRKILTCWKLRW